MNKKKAIRILIRCTLKYLQTIIGNANLYTMMKAEAYRPTHIERVEILEAIDIFADMAEPTKAMRLDIERMRPKGKASTPRWCRDDRNPVARRRAQDPACR